MKTCTMYMALSVYLVSVKSEGLEYLQVSREHMATFEVTALSVFWEAQSGDFWIVRDIASSLASRSTSIMSFCGLWKEYRCHS